MQARTMGQQEKGKFQKDSLNESVYYKDEDVGSKLFVFLWRKATDMKRDPGQCFLII